MKKLMLLIVCAITIVSCTSKSGKLQSTQRRFRAHRLTNNVVFLAMFDKGYRVGDTILYGRTQIVLTDTI